MLLDLRSCVGVLHTERSISRGVGAVVTDIYIDLANI
jgi:hypothetical protein